MKKIITIPLLLLTLFSCKKAIDEENYDHSDGIELGASVVDPEIEVAYSSDPGLLVPVLAPTTNVNSSCGLLYGNKLNMKVYRITDNVITFQIDILLPSPTDNGKLQLRVDNPCGEVLDEFSYFNGTLSYFATHSFISTYGNKKIYATLKLNDIAQTIYYSSPITINITSTGDNYTSTQWGKVLGSYNGTIIYSNGNTSIWNKPYNTSNANGYNTGIKWQCVEFVNRYYYEHYGMKIRIAGKNANQYFSTAIQRGLIAYTNGGSEPPKVGDILCFGGGPKDANGDQFGHVALITEVSGTRIRVSQQNVGISTHINFSFERKSGNIIDPTNLDKKYKRFFTQGWLRKP
jgi:hypothetical protein